MSKTNLVAFIASAYLMFVVGCVVSAAVVLLLLLIGVEAVLAYFVGMFVGVVVCHIDAVQDVILDGGDKIVELCVKLGVLSRT